MLWLGDYIVEAYPNIDLVTASRAVSLCVAPLGRKEDFQLGGVLDALASMLSMFLL